MKSSVNSNYDLIASLFDYDMALNMRFDDVGFYVDRTRGKDAVLEVGSGTGRIGIPVSKVCNQLVAIDASLPMLLMFQQKLQQSREASSNILLAVMDARSLALKQKFDYIFFGFSSINYLTHPDEVMAFIESLKPILQTNGRLLLDVFVPKNLAILSTDWTLDYVRPLPSGGQLKRSKQITPDRSVNVIKRRYEEYSAAGIFERVIDTESRIRPYRPEELRAMLMESGFSICGEWWDYGQSSADNAGFFSIEATLL
ncbi:MAG TPA: hypothetical protein DIW64_15835 [Cellvibrio sp.]|nr:hypothetical protein [Cellvibrio sp.]